VKNTASSEKRKKYFSGGENIPQVCIVERPGGSAHLLGGIHRLTSSSKRYQPSEKAQAKTKTFAISSFSTTAKHHNSPQNTAVFPNETQAQCLVEYRKAK
jgi:hypothetical protein